MTTYENLLKKTNYAKNSKLKNQIYEVYGMVKMARELEAITSDEFMTLNHELVCKGLNNSEFIKHWNRETFELARSLAI